MVFRIFNHIRNFKKLPPLCIQNWKSELKFHGSYSNRRFWHLTLRNETIITVEMLGNGSNHRVVKLMKIHGSEKKKPFRIYLVFDELFIELDFFSRITVDDVTHLANRQTSASRKFSYDLHVNMFKSRLILTKQSPKTVSLPKTYSPLHEFQHVGQVLSFTFCHSSKYCN